MKNRTLSVLLAVLIPVAMVACESEDDPGYSLCGPDETCAGQSYAQHAQDWWTWAMQIPAANHPILDGSCDQNQPGDVFYLAGNFGGSSARSCTIPAGTPIFFPILNNITYSCPEVWGEDDCSLVTDEQLTGAVEGGLSLPVGLTLLVDGEPVDGLQEHRADTGAFDADCPESDPSLFHFTADQMEPGVPAADVECMAEYEAGNQCGQPVGVRRVAGGGWWAMVTFNKPGQHTLSFAGVVNPDEPYFELDVTYNLTIE